jgi:hypothetical protein
MHSSQHGARRHGTHKILEYVESLTLLIDSFFWAHRGGSDGARFLHAWDAAFLPDLSVLADIELYADRVCSIEPANSSSHASANYLDVVEVWRSSIGQLWAVNWAAKFIREGGSHMELSSLIGDRGRCRCSGCILIEWKP